MQKIREAGGEVFAITSEPQTLANHAAQSWETEMTHIGDPHQEILDDCRSRQWLDLFTQEWDKGMAQGTDSWMSHPKGHFQPGVLVLRRDGTVLYRWRSKPGRKNAGGAIERPAADYIWGQIEAALASNKTTDADYDETPAMDQKQIFWPLFVMELLANGNFIRPRVFNLQPGDAGKIYNNVGKRRKIAHRRIAMFLAGWAVGFLTMPVGLVAGLLAAWSIWITPGIIRIHKGFQNVS